MTRVITGIRRKYDLAIPVRDFFANPTIASIASLLAKRLGVVDAVPENENASERIRKRMPEIDSFFQPVASEQLFVVRYVPRNVPSGQRRGLLVCQADGHEYVRSYRNLQQMALQFASAGMDVMRFDYSSCGNSSGSNRDGRVERWVEEIRAVASMYRERANLDHVTILAVRFGALLVQEALGEPGAAPHVADRVIYWDPIQSGDRYLKMLDSFQRHSLLSVTDFLVPRRTQIAQTFGVELPDEKRQGYQRLELRPDSTVGNEGHSVPLSIITSQSYRDDEGLRLGPAVPVIETSDTVCWNELRYCNAAFSSPEIAKAIGRLVGVTPR